MDALVAAAKKEGTLNVIALPPDWANYGAIISALPARSTGIKVNSAQPDASSADEISAATRLKGQSSAPDVFDLGDRGRGGQHHDVRALQGRDVRQTSPPTSRTRTAPGSTTTAATCPSATTPPRCPPRRPSTTCSSPSTRARSPSTATRPRPVRPSPGCRWSRSPRAARAGDVTKGVDFFKQLKEAGNFIPVDPTPATIDSGQTPVVIDWDYLNAAQTAKVPTWKVYVPDNAVVAGYYVAGRQRGRPAPGRRAAVAGVPLLRRGPEPVAQGWRPSGPLRRHEEGRHARRHCAAALPARHRHARSSRRQADSDTAKAYLAKQLGQRGWLTVRDAGRALGGVRPPSALLGRRPLLRLHHGLPAHPHPGRGHRRLPRRRQRPTLANIRALDPARGHSAPCGTRSCSRP